MPLWKIFHTPGTFSDVATKEALSNDITKYYTSNTGMPAFYVGVVFISLPEAALFLGGKPRGAEQPFVRLEVDQILIRLPDDDAAYKGIMQTLGEMLKPHLSQFSWEIHIDETDRRLWSIDGIEPPGWKSEEEAKWRGANRPLERL